MAFPVPTLLLAIAAALAAATGTAAVLARCGFPLPPGGARIGHVDGLRGYLALAVLAHHFLLWFQFARLGGAWTTLSPPVFNELGTGGVALFFMITGLLFYPRILAGFRRTAWTATFVTRVFRIVPLVAVSVAAVVAVIAARTGRSWLELSPGDVARWLSAASEPDLLGDRDSWRVNANVLWSLRCEWIFYLLILPGCALAMDAVRGRLPGWSVPAALLGGAALGRVLHVPMPILQYVPLFAIGMLVHAGSADTTLRRIAAGPAFGLVAGAGFAGAVLLLPLPFDAALPFFALFFAAIACGNVLASPLASKAALVLGECSFGIYLLHGIALSLLFPWLRTLAVSDGAVPLALPLVTVAVVLAAAAGCLLVERPCIRLGRGVAKGLLVALERGRQGRVPAPVPR